MYPSLIRPPFPIVAVIRAPGIPDLRFTRPPGVGLCVQTAEAGGGRGGREMSFADVGDLLAVCAVEARALDQTLYCTYVEGGGAPDWSAALDDRSLSLSLSIRVAVGVGTKMPHSLV